MTAEQILNEIKALPELEREQLLQRVRQLEADEIPKDFDEALADFEQQRFVPMETALNKVPAQLYRVRTHPGRVREEIDPDKLGQLPDDFG